MGAAPTGALRAEARADLARLRARYPAQFRADRAARARFVLALGALIGVPGSACAHWMAATRAISRGKRETVIPMVNLRPGLLKGSAV